MIARYRDGVLPDGGRRRGELAADFEGLLARGWRATSTRRSSRPALEADLGARAPAQPLRRGAGALEAGQGPRARAASSTASLASLAEGLRIVTVLLGPTCRSSRERLLDALGAGELAAPAFALAGLATAARSPRSAPLFPKDAAPQPA